MPDGFSDTSWGQGSGLSKNEVDTIVISMMAEHLRYDHKYSLSKIQGILGIKRKELKYMLRE
jgi:hypothetical protein